jgi:hypothetical protein
MNSFLRICSVITLFILPLSAQDNLPLLPEGTHVGIAFHGGDFSEDVQEQLELRLLEAIERGVNTIEVSMDWSELEDGQGNITLEALEDYFIQLQDLGLRPYMVIPTINTDILVAPRDLMDPVDPKKFRDGMTFRSKTVKARFFKVVKRVAALLIEYDGFFISIGNEVDVYLSQTDQWEAYESFVRNMRRGIKRNFPEMAVGVTLTAEGVFTKPDECSSLLKLCDVASYTHYPLNFDFTIKSVNTFREDIRRLVEFANGIEVLLQEAGCPSGYEKDSIISSTEIIQKRYVQRLMYEVRRQPSIRFVSVFKLLDWNDEVTDWLVGRYGFDEEGKQNLAGQRFREYLRTLGLLNEYAQPKKAWQEFLKQVKTTVNYHK